MEKASTSPNKETIQAMLEAEQIVNDSSIQGYTDIDSLFEDLDKL